MKPAVRPALFRMAHIDEKLHDGSWPNASTLARDLEVTPRTIHRDIEYMRDQRKAPIAFDPTKNGYYYTEPSFRLPFFSVSEGEYVALFLAERMIQQCQGTSFAGDLARLFEKVTDLLTEPISINLQHLRESVSLRQCSADLGEAARFDVLHRAIQRGRQLELVYWTASRDETCRRVVDPYHLASLDGDWYLVAYCHLREKVRLFAPGRIRELRETGESFERPREFKINEYLDVGFRKMRGDGPLQTVRLRFTPSAARYVREREWHPTQKLRQHADGSLTLTFRVSHLLEVRRWVMSFGADCVVLAPQELKDEIINEIRRMLEKQ